MTMTDVASREDELRDLSAEDAGELRAFVEKRRWFEEKLKASAAVHSITIITYDGKSRSWSPCRRFTHSFTQSCFQ